MSASHSGAINILIVDDEPKNLTVLETILDDPHYRLVRAESPDEALLALVADEFALLILDIRMPGMTGFELAQMIKERKKTASVPIIFLTAYYNEDQHMLEGYGTGAVDYLHKPVNPAVLRSKVAVFAELYSKRRELAEANRALIAENAERRRVEDDLRQLNETLEQRVSNRTQALAEISSALQESFALLDTLAATAPVGLAFIDRDLKFARVNETLADYHGVPLNDHLGRKVAEVVPDLWPDLQPLLQRAIAGEPVVNIEVSGTSATSGDVLHWLASYYPVQVQTETIGAGVVMVDVTSQKKLQQAITEADRRKDEFLATLAHELRNPLAPIRNSLQIIKLAPGDAEIVQEARTVMERQLAQMVHLVDDLLDVSRISRGKLDLRIERVDLNVILNNALETSRSLIESSGHELRVDLPSEPLFMDADVTRLGQVFANLLNNAAKYSERGSQIALTAARLGREIVVSVKDNGIGIPTEMLHQIFELFTQVDQSLERSNGGLGIGLSLVQRLVQMHGGDVKAHSDGSGRGSEFIVRLPLAVLKSSPAEPSSPGGPAATSTPPRRILIADDNEDSATSLARILKIMGNEVHTANDGEEAVILAATFRPDVILMDIGMPRMNGYDACREIRSQPWGKETVLIAQTGWGQNEDKKRSRDAGFDLHIVKPMDPMILEGLLTELKSSN
ncbi:response regulator [Schlesneria sp.]|uniref:hybrid sensor histidine kinase/response regulator n=1 Tax=Schlesneria sp. TaxID=2762018 RepID=UPI002EFB596F